MLPRKPRNCRYLGGPRLDSLEGAVDARSCEATAFWFARTLVHNTWMPETTEIEDTSPPVANGGINGNSSDATSALGNAARQIVHARRRGNVCQFDAMAVTPLKNKDPTTAAPAICTGTRHASKRGVRATPNASGSYANTRYECRAQVYGELPAIRTVGQESRICPCACEGAEEAKNGTRSFHARSRDRLSARVCF